MIGLDTNVLVRYIMQDDPRQSPKASTLIEGLNNEEPGFITVVTVIELVWVLSSCYSLSRDQLAQAIDAILRTKELIVDHADQVVRALRTFRSSSADFADCLIACIGANAGCSRTVTFDKGAASAAGMALIR